MSHSMFNYDQEQAVQAGVSNYVSDSGAYGGKLLTAEWVVSTQKGTKGIELTFETVDGLKANYLTIWYQKSTGEQLAGSKMLNAIMGCCKVTSLTSKVVNHPEGPKYFCPELESKSLGLILQKVLYTKSDLSDGYKFEIRLPFIAQTGKTLAEQIGNKDAVAVNKVLATLTDKDDRTSGTAQSHANASNGVPNDFNEALDGW